MNLPIIFPYNNIKEKRFSALKSNNIKLQMVVNMVESNKQIYR